ncbi:MAG TPA: hypothetical protein VM347_12760 [Nonomuraea sp.]|nr:hypothetical protein [Nonomuraea sp.]
MLHLQYIWRSTSAGRLGPLCSPGNFGRISPTCTDTGPETAARRAVQAEDGQDDNGEKAEAEDGQDDKGQEAGSEAREGKQGQAGDQHEQEGKADAAEPEDG